MSLTHKLRNIMQPSFTLADMINEMDFNNPEQMRLLKETAALALAKQMDIHNELDYIDTFDRTPSEHEHRYDISIYEKDQHHKSTYGQKGKVIYTEHGCNIALDRIFENCGKFVICVSKVRHIGGGLTFRLGQYDSEKQLQQENEMYGNLLKPVFYTFASKLKKQLQEEQDAST